MLPQPGFKWKWMAEWPSLLVWVRANLNEERGIWDWWLNLWVGIWFVFRKNGFASNEHIANLWSISTHSAQKLGLLKLFVYKYHVSKTYRLMILVQVFKDWYQCMITVVRPWDKHFQLLYNTEDTSVTYSLSECQPHLFTMSPMTKSLSDNHSIWHEENVSSWLCYF